MPGTVAITGATGFIGGHLARRLSQAGWRLRLLARQPERASVLGLDPARTIVVAGSLAEPDRLRTLLESVDAVVHLAGLVKARNRAAFFEANAAGTQRLAEAAGAGADPPLFILVSSLAAREPRVSDYAASKAAGEAALRAAPVTPGSSVILRPPVVYGPGDREILPLFRAISHRIGAALGPPDARLSLLHVEDLAAAIESLLTADPPGDGWPREAYELDDGRAGGYSWAELVDAAAAALQTRPLRLRVPAGALRLVALAGQGAAALHGRPAMLGPGKVHEILHPDWVARGARLGEATGWRPRIGLAEGFDETVAWYRRQGWL
jgi:nucleoside-diphosphate-sugar epimerase